MPAMQPTDKPVKRLDVRMSLSYEELSVLESALFAYKRDLQTTRKEDWVKRAPTHAARLLALVHNIGHVQNHLNGWRTRFRKEAY